MNVQSELPQWILGLWVPLAIGCFFVMRPLRATLVVILGGDMFLPELVGFKFPFLPPLDKHNLPYLCTLVGCLLCSRSRLTRPPVERWFLRLSVLLFVGGAVTGLTNADSVLRNFHPRLPGLNLKDGLFLGVVSLTTLSLPFFLGCTLFRTPKDLRDLLAGFAIAGIIYAPFALLEIRLSPQFHRWVYGYHQHSDFQQTIRWGGYRPMVFMSHGLALARFFLVAAFAPFVLGRSRRALLGVPTRVVGWGLVVVLVLCKSTGAIIYAIVALPLLRWGKSKLRARVALVLATFVFLYPVLRELDILPTEGILQVSRALVGADRTDSLEFRFTNEDLMLERARQRPLFGWGSYGRNFTHDFYGKEAIVDGYWLIQIGMLGVAGFVASFGILLIPLFLTRRRLKLIPLEADRTLVGGLALTLGVIALDFVPNGLWAPYPYMLAGALAGVTRELMVTREPMVAREPIVARDPIVDESMDVEDAMDGDSQPTRA